MRSCTLPGLRLRSDVANTAVVAYRRAEHCEGQLRDLTRDLNAQLELQLGALIAKRRIKIGEVVGTWPKTRGKRQAAHVNEISRQEFKDEVAALGLMQHGQPVTRAAIGKLFDSVDKDGSGYLDMKEAKAALKLWGERWEAADAAVRAKKAELDGHRRRASQKARLALRVEQGVDWQALREMVRSSPRSYDQSAQRLASPPATSLEPATALW